MAHSGLHVSAICALSLALAGCGAPSSAPAPDASGVKITSDDGETRTVESEDGLISATGNKGAEEARFPAHAPAYPGAKVLTSVDVNMGTMTQHIITMLTPDAEEAVLTFYEEKAKAANLPVKRMSSPSGTILAIGEPGLGGMTDTMVTTLQTDQGLSVNIAVSGK